MNSRYQTMRLVLGDQLNARHTWFNAVDDSVVYVVAELHQELNYVTHHIQKVAAFFLAIENFAKALRKAGHHVLYLTLDDTAEFDSLAELVAYLCDKYSIGTFCYQHPDEFRLSEQMKSLTLDPEITIESVDTQHFLLGHEEMRSYVKPKQHNRMEAFYRKMRKRFDILMDGDLPLGGKWNYDQLNREKLSVKDLEFIPEPLVFGNNVKHILARLEKHKVKTIGRCEATILWPANRQQSLELLSYFCQFCLPAFGRFQDAMTMNHQHQWSLYHSRLSFALNAKMLHPMQVIKCVIDTFNSRQQKSGVSEPENNRRDLQSSDLNLAQVEGFIRQILGWREYVRCVYWVNMPDYAELNVLGAKASLPEYFWTGETKMQCVKHAVSQTLEYAYAHHIQRLMVTGNFCLLAGIHPDDVDQWYLAVYIDAIEWVEMPNTRGMSQFADGGWVATKPYVASGNYINKMSDYCKQCEYKVKEKSSESACPLNSLYWHFLDRHRRQLSRNSRISLVYKNWDRQSASQRQATLSRANWCLQNLDKL